MSAFDKTGSVTILQACDPVHQHPQAASPTNALVCSRNEGCNPSSWSAPVGLWRSNRQWARARGPATASPEQRRNPSVAGGATAPASCAGPLASPSSDAVAGEDASSVSFVGLPPRRKSPSPPVAERARAPAMCSPSSSGMPSRNELAVLQSRDDAMRPAGTRGVGGGALRVGRAASRLATATGRTAATKKPAGDPPGQAAPSVQPPSAATKRERAAMRVRAVRGGAEHRRRACRPAVCAAASPARPGADRGRYSFDVRAGRYLVYRPGLERF